MELHDELKCFGLMGFGSGIVWGRANIKPGEKLNGMDGHCARECPEAQHCLMAHRAKAQMMFPKATLAFDKMMDRVGQLRAMTGWAKTHPQTPLEPYALLMVMNAEDGLAFQQTGKVKDRGDQTLRYPKVAA